MDKPIIEQIKESVPTTNDIKEGSLNTMDSINKSIDEAKNGVTKSLQDFSNKSIVDASSEFLNSNSLLAKFAFIFLVFIVFMIILKIAIAIMGFFLSPSRSPYVIKGKINGSEFVEISQDPKKEDSIPILKSNDRHRGIEFTWSSWLFMNDTQELSKFSPIFIKGNNNKDGRELYLTNGPGVYVKQDLSGGFQHQTIHILMDHVHSSPVSDTGASMTDTKDGANKITNSTVDDTKLDQARDHIVIDNIPIKKWFHLAIRMQNMIMDVYVNGTIVKRHNMDKIPKQNYQNILAGVDYRGSLADLRYFDRALNVFEINNIVMFGPNTRPSDRSVDSSSRSGNFSYLSSMWYNEAHNP
jgi:hypothetical protein